MDNPEPHVVKSNPLMKHFMSFNENGGFMSDSSDAESANVHSDAQNHLAKGFSSDDGKSLNLMNSDSECLPEEDVSITEDSEKQGENNRTFHNGSVRRKLYFNPVSFLYYRSGDLILQKILFVWSSNKLFHNHLKSYPAN